MSRTVALPENGDGRDFLSYCQICLLSAPYILLAKGNPVEKAGLRQSFCSIDYIGNVFKVIELCKEYYIFFLLNFVCRK